MIYELECFATFVDLILGVNVSSINVAHLKDDQGAIFDHSVSFRQLKQETSSKNDYSYPFNHERK